jgi:type II secretory pathway component PulC
MLSLIRGELPGTEIVELQISRAEFDKASARQEINSKARIIQIFKGSSIASGIPEYRLMGIEPGSIYYLLGLRTADILLGAHDRIIVNPGVFKDYIVALKSTDSSSIEIRRSEQPLLIKLQFSNS